MPFYVRKIVFMFSRNFLPFIYDKKWIAIFKKIHRFLKESFYFRRILGYYENAADFEDAHTVLCNLLLMWNEIGLEPFSHPYNRKTEAILVGTLMITE